MIDIISRNHAFDEFSMDHKKFIAEHSDIHRIRWGEVLFKQWKRAEYCYIILIGGVQIFRDGNGSGIPLYGLGAGSIMGWSWLPPASRWSFSCRAVIGTSFIRIRTNKLRQKMEEDQNFAYQIYKIFYPIVVERLIQTRRHLKELIMQDIMPSDNYDMAGAGIRHNEGRISKREKEIHLNEPAIH